MSDWVASVYAGKVVYNDREVLGGKELDIYLPDAPLAIEFNGLYWHSEQFKTRTCHHDKWAACHERGISPVQVWADD